MSECLTEHLPGCPHPCGCNGMEFLYNRWVFTGSCYHRYTSRPLEPREEQ